MHKDKFNVLTEEDLKNLITLVISEITTKAQQDLTVSNLEPEILRPKQVQVILGCSRSHLDLLSQKDPNFPKVIRLGNRWTGYLKSEIDTYLKNLSSTIH